MIKKAIIGGVAVAVLGGLVMWTGARSYVRTVGTEVRQAFKGAVPLEFELKRARVLLQDVDPEINRYKHVIATEEVIVEKLQREVQDLNNALAAHDADMKKLWEKSGGGKSSVQLTGRTYSSDDVQRDLASRVSRGKARKQELQARTRQLEAKSAVVIAAHNKLQAMVSKKRELEAQVDMLEAKLQEVQARETASNIVIDDSDLSRTKQLIDEIDTQIRVKEKVLSSTGSDLGEIPVGSSEAVTPEEVSSQVEEYLKGSTVPPTVEEGPKT